MRKYFKMFTAYMKSKGQFNAVYRKKTIPQDYQVSGQNVILKRFYRILSRTHKVSWRETDYANLFTDEN